MNLESYFPALKFCFHVLLSTCSPTSRVEAWRHLPAAGCLCGAYKRWALRGLEAPVAWRACITSWKKRGTFLVGESRFEGFEGTEGGNGGDDTALHGICSRINTRLDFSQRLRTPPRRHCFPQFFRIGRVLRLSHGDLPARYEPSLSFSTDSFATKRTRECASALAKGRTHAQLRACVCTVPTCLLNVVCNNISTCKNYRRSFHKALAMPCLRPYTPGSLCRTPS